MREVTSSLAAFGVNIVAKALADSPDSAFSLAIGLVMVSCSHIEINLDIGHKLLPKAGGESRVSFRDDRSGETVDREHSFDQDVGSFDCCDILRDWDKVGEPSEAIQPNQDSFFLVVPREGSCKVNCNRGKGFSGNRERGDDSVREGGRLFVPLTKVTSANIVIEICSHCHPVEVPSGVFETFLGSHVRHLFMSNAKDFASEVISFVDCFIGNIWTVTTVLLPSFKKKSINENPTSVVGVLADYIKERICGCSFSEGVVPFAFEVLSELKGANTKRSGGLVRERVIVIDRGIRDGKVFIWSNMV